VPVAPVGETAYDRILIGSRIQTEASPAGGSGVGGTTPSHHLRPHWRRGDFRRIRYDEGLSESRLGWIQPVLVNAADALGSVKAKTYAVR
jgi:hypothetical protein